LEEADELLGILGLLLGAVLAVANDDFRKSGFELFAEIIAGRSV
jgi:hypothetical protein